MSYLFLSFSDKMEKKGKFGGDLYSASLNDQFAQLQKKIPLDRQVASLNRFIETCFPSGMKKKYYFSCPNFIREKRVVAEGRSSFLDNVVVRPEYTMSMRRVLPDNQTVILIGDIYESAKAKVFQVKGIQLIDLGMQSPRDVVVNAEACSAFGKDQSMSRMGNMVTYEVWSIDRVDLSDTILTPNFISDLIESCWTVNSPSNIIKTYREWQKYIEFRNYYLSEQSKRNFKLDNAMFVEAYAVNRKTYKANSSIYDDYLLDGRDDFKWGDMIVLSQKIEEAEDFPLIRLDIERNKKAFNEARVQKRGKLVNEEERKIRSLASDNVFITSIDPNSESEFRDRNGKVQKVTFGELLNSGYALGDRFKIVSYEIEPIEHLNQLDSQYDVDINRAYKNIDAKYERIIKKEIEDLVSKYEEEQRNLANVRVKQKEAELSSTLDDDIKENKDSDILSNIARLKKAIELNANKIKQDKKEKDKDYKDRIKKYIEEEQSKINVRELYVERNRNILEQFTKNAKREVDKLVLHYNLQKTPEITNKYKEDIRLEKVNTKDELDSKLKKDKAKAIEEETIIRFSLYFRLGDTNNIISDKQKNIVNKCEYIVYDSRAEKAKISRQEQALNNFFSGYVKNPYLSTYLFNPEELNTVNAEPSDWIWYLESLNDMQKEAVRKAVSSNGIFLLQGPPGTGKTQVIAETVAQLIKKGKKVLISSETHKAIDNVFERLPKIAEIVPIRLIPSNNDKKKENEYDPKFLVDNFYSNISTNMKKAVNRYKNFKKNKEEFSENFDKLKLSRAKIEKYQKVLDKANEEISKLEEKTKQINSKISVLTDKKDDLRTEIDILRRTKRHIDNDNLRPDDDIKTNIILDFRKELEPLFDKNIYNSNIDLGQLLKNIDAIKNEEVVRELSLINPESNRTLLEIKRTELKNELDKYVDDLGDLINPDDEEKVNEIKAELRNVLKQLKSESSSASLSDLKLNSIYLSDYLVSNVELIDNNLKNIKDRILEIKSIYLGKVNDELYSLEDEQKELDDEINNLKQQIKDINENIIDIQERNDVKDIQEAKYKLENDLIKFFKDFEIAEPYKDVDEALKIIKRKWSELEDDYASKEQENKEKIPMYEKIANYITSEDVIEGDRKDFTKDLFESANVFGITCTSNDRFSGKNVDALSEYNIDDIDIKSVGIDVVIIDEVSKSSFIDLLIPILYGKTVILVGDHRQLPPMYEFAKLRDDDYEGLDENIINKEINKKFTDLYEECFFKTLFERIPDSYKTMLVQQYRCHEHIMNVFNHFYRGELKLGFAGQNNNKRHNVKLLSNGRNIIEPDKHIYFVDCKQTETHEADSTSMYNTGEAKVVITLISKLNTYFKSHPELEKLSIGVICTYGDQARRIKELLRSEKVKTDAFKTDVEKMIVSTVDDFQGDERDIIILTTVRNPEDPKRSNPGFILAYQRINVALSRARRMLLMVGNRKYLETKGVIDLPDVYGRSNKDQKNFHVYEEILATIERYGKVIEDIDVLDEKEAKING